MNPTVMKWSKQGYFYFKLSYFISISSRSLFYDQAFEP